MGLFGFGKNKVNVNNKSNEDLTIINRLLLGLGFKYTRYDQNNKTYIDEGYNSNADVFAIVNQKSTEANRIPYCIKKVKDDQSKSKFIQLKNSTKHEITTPTLIKKLRYETKAFDEEELKMPLDKPNPYMSWGDFISLFTVFINCTGNFYVYKVSPEDGMNKGIARQYYILPAHLMQIVLKENADMLNSDDVIDYYILTEGERQIRISKDKVIHIKLPNPNFDLSGSHLYGHSRLRAGVDNMQSSNAAVRLNSKTLANGGAFGFISTKEPMTPEQAQSIKDRLVEMDNSEKRLSNLAGSSKEVVFTRISLTADELKVFDYLKYDRKTLCNILIWDDILLNNDDGAKYDNFKFVMRRALTTGVLPDLRLLESEFFNAEFRKFKGYEGTEFFFDETQLPEMQEDLEKTVKNLSLMLSDGAINRAEYRMAVNYGEADNNNMEVFTVSKNIMALDDAIEMPDDFNINPPKE